MRTFSKLAAIFFIAVHVGSCHSTDASSNGEPQAELSARYSERVGDVFKIVNLGLERCSLAVRQGPQNAITGNTTTCTQSELQDALVLLSNDAWQSYVGLTPAELQIQGAAGSGSGGVGNLSASTSGGEGGCASCSAEPAGDLGQVDLGTNSLPDGSATVVNKEKASKVFWANSTGPESQLIQFFRGLHEKYLTAK